MITKETALSTVGSVRRFIRWRYFHPEIEEYAPEMFLDGWMKELDALEEYINSISSGQSVGGKNS